MRTASIIGAAALRERLATPAQVDASVPESDLPAYMESFLAHLRLLIGTPFDYLVPDSRLLPDEAIRFFYVDRSWTDRLVDGAIAVGKIGTREQAHHQGHSADIQSQLDLQERVVRTLQRGITPSNPSQTPANVITGFLLRSAAVSGWPSMDVRAFSQVVPPSPGNVNDPSYATWAANADKVQLTTLRLELLSPSVLLALFDGVPQLVWCEEPHHGVQFAVTTSDELSFFVDRHKKTGDPEQSPQVPVPMRSGGHRVVDIQALRTRLFQLNDPNLIPQTGSAALAIELLEYPWRQRFEGKTSQRQPSSGAFVPKYSVASVIQNPSVSTNLQEVLR